MIKNNYVNLARSLGYFYNCKFVKKIGKNKYGSSYLLNSGNMNLNLELLPVGCIIAFWVYKKVNNI